MSLIKLSGTNHFCFCQIQSCVHRLIGRHKNGSPKTDVGERCLRRSDLRFARLHIVQQRCREEVRGRIKKSIEGVLRGEHSGKQRSKSDYKSETVGF
jgi:hypothetical protein